MAWQALTDGFAEECSLQATVPAIENLRASNPPEKIKLAGDGPPTRSPRPGIRGGVR
ncbi:hypothetical protein MASSI9I_40085 [Massilia sp. 9I]|nr:hypothetical protein MASSI9I_40085 [Massilia sp. 9I]